MVSFYFTFQRLWNKDFLYTQKDRIYFYDCLRAKYVDVKIADIAGINDYGLPIYPYTILIIYTIYGRIFTCPDLAEGGKDKISERIYEIIYKTGNNADWYYEPYSEWFLMLGNKKVRFWQWQIAFLVVFYGL